MGEENVKKFNRLLKVRFTEQQKLGLAERIASAVRDLKQQQDDLGSITARYRSEIKATEAQIASLAEQLNTGWEMKNVVCSQLMEYQTGTVYIVRDDTEELVEERPMDPEERQQELPLEPAPDEPE